MKIQPTEGSSSTLTSSLMSIVIFNQVRERIFIFYLHRMFAKLFKANVLFYKTNSPFFFACLYDLVRVQIFLIFGSCSQNISYVLQKYQNGKIFEDLFFFRIVKILHHWSTRISKYEGICEGLRMIRVVVPLRYKMDDVCLATKGETRSKTRYKGDSRADFEKFSPLFFTEAWCFLFTDKRAHNADLSDLVCVSIVIIFDVWYCQKFTAVS